MVFVASQMSENNVRPIDYVAGICHAQTQQQNKKYRRFKMFHFYLDI